MADKNGKLTLEEGRRCNARFESYEKNLGRDLPCEICGHIVWRLNTHIVTVLGDSSHGILGSTVRTPLINYVCTNCGNMKFFAAKMWGVESAVETDPLIESVSGEDAPNGD